MLPAIAKATSARTSPKARTKPAKPAANGASSPRTEAEDDAASPDSVHSPIPHETPERSRLKPTAPSAMHIPPFRGGPARTYVEAEPEK